MAQVLANSVVRTTQGWIFPRETNKSLDSTGAIVGWTLLTVFAFWTPVALLAYMVAA